MQSGIKGLVVLEVGPSTFAGKATQMNCTAVPNADKSVQTELKFNQAVGESMEKALHEVRKHLTVVRGELPTGYTLEFAFEDKYSPKDGPSAAVACALMMDALLTGTEIDPKFAVTGDLNADGAVQPVGGVPDKIRGAAKRDCTHVAVPQQVEIDLGDLLLTEGPKPLWDIQIFAIKTLEEAQALASTARPEKLQKALDGFAEIQRVLQQRKDPALLANPKVLERLRAVVESAPNHLSAKLLLLQGTGKAPKTLSLRGSLEYIDKSTGTLLSNIKTPRPEGVDADLLGKALSELVRIRTKLDTRTLSYADTLSEFGTMLRNLKNNPPKGPTEGLKALGKLREAGGRVDAAVAKLRGDKTLMEELMK